MSVKPVAGAAPLDRATEEVAGAGQAPSPLVLLGHDLRAALADMRAGLELIRALALPEATQDTLRRCLASGDALSRLIDQSVLVCLGQASPGLSCPVSFDTAAFLDEVAARWAGVARDNGHRFVLRAADLPGALYMDRTGVERILANLIGNALRHTPPGEVVLSLGQAEGAAMLRLELADSGPGFAPAVLAAFGKDLSLPDHLRRPGGGFGLQSVGYLVQAMGGSCEIGNRPDGSINPSSSSAIARPPAIPGFAAQMSAAAPIAAGGRTSGLDASSTTIRGFRWRPGPPATRSARRSVRVFAVARMAVWSVRPLPW